MSAPQPASRGDRTLLLGMLLGLALCASLTPIRNYDFWWHLATGRLILQQGAIPRADPFSFTAPGAPWVDHEWLFQVLSYGAMRVAGPSGLVLLKVLGVLLMALLMIAHLRREGHGPAGTAVILLPAFLGSAFRLDVRPEMVTLLLVPLGLHLVLWARDHRSGRGLCAVPALVALGANLHVGIVILPAILGLGACVTFVRERILTRVRPDEAGPPGSLRSAGRLAATAGIAALAAGLNPYGFRIYAVPFRVASLLASLPSPNLEWARPEARQFPLFFLGCALLLLLLVLGRDSLDPVAMPATLLVGVPALLHLRNIGLFFLLLPYGIARPARALVARAQRGRVYRIGTLGGRVRPGFVTAAVLLVGAIPALALLPPRLAWGLRVSSDNEPGAAADFLAREGVGDRLFNDVLFGGYLIWRRYPDHKVFIDGRNEVYASLLPEIFASLGDADSWERLLDRYGIDAAILRYPPELQNVIVRAPGDRPEQLSHRAFSAVHFPQDRWALVYWDDDAMIFLRKGERWREVIDRLEYRALNPDDWRYAYASVLTGGRDVAPILGEINRKLTEDPSSARARTLWRAFGGLAEALAGRGSPHPGGRR